jgi:hypothetical protein
MSVAGTLKNSRSSSLVVTRVVQRREVRAAEFGSDLRS